MYNVGRIRFTLFGKTHKTSAWDRAKTEDEVLLLPGQERKMPEKRREMFCFVQDIGRRARETMKRQISWKQYRAIDLVLWGTALAVFEYLIVHAANWWFPGQPFTVSLAAAVASIVYMRWGAWGILHAVEAGLVFCWFSGGTEEQLLIYCAGNAVSVLAVFLLKAVGKEKVRMGYWGLVFPLLVQVLMQGGRALVALALGTEPGNLPGFFTTDSLSLLFTFVIIWIARRLDGIYEDQKHYLLRLNEEEGGKRR